MKIVMTLIIGCMITGCASTKQFLRPMNYYGVEKSKSLMEYEGYVPVAGTDRNLFVVKGEDADLYRSEMQEYRVTTAIARAAQANGESYTAPVVPETYGLRTITAEDWFESNRERDNNVANIIDTLWNGVLVGGTLVAGESISDAFSGGGGDDSNSADTTITAGGNVNYVSESAVGGSVGSVPQPVTVEGIEP